MRGNLDPVVDAGADDGSIPAYAGEPCDGNFPNLVFQVYPRVCGGTAPETPRRSLLTGLSPRMRGNLLRPQSGPL